MNRKEKILQREKELFGDEKETCYSDKENGFHMKDKFAIVELYCGMNELILYNDKRRLWQVCHQIKCGFIILITFGKVIPKFIDYYENEKELEKLGVH